MSPKHPLVETFSRRMAARRRRRKLSQAKLAVLIGTTQAFVCQLERGTRIPSLKLLAKLAAALSTTPDALLRPEKIPA